MAISHIIDAVKFGSHCGTIKMTENSLFLKAP